MPSFYYERKFKRRGFELVAGVDEAGRGPLAGPVLACALVLNKFSFKEKIDDSKRLSFSQRKRAYQEIIQKSVFGVGSVGEKEIDELNIQRATLRAMEVAMFNLIGRLNKISKKEIFPSTCAPLGICFLIDGNIRPEVDYYCENIIGGDNKSLSIACASIVAKVRRDDIMCDYHRLYPEYGFTRHKGYATAEHREAISQFGQSPIHRRSFRSQDVK